ncbi:rod shape-determining protein MreC [Gemmatimonadota bacterium]
MASYTESPEEGRGRRNLIVAVVFFALSIVVLYLPAEFQDRVAAGLRISVLRPFLLTQETLVQARRRAEDAGVLQARLDSLAAALAAQAPLVAESRRLHELLELRERAPEVFQAASVIRPGTAGSESMFLLDVGSDQGVRPGDPVLMRDGRIGLVGVVRQVRPGTSIGLDWSHPDFRASAMSEDGNVFGIVEQRRGVFREEDRLLFNGTPFFEGLEPGTLIVTSGRGGFFPPGIPIGEVVALAEQENRWRKAYWLRPVVETGSVSHVLVVVGDVVNEGLMELFLGEPGMSADSLGSSGREPRAPLEGGGG